MICNNFPVFGGFGNAFCVHSSHVCKAGIGNMNAVKDDRERTTHWMHPGTDCGEKQGHRDASLKG